MLNFCSGDGVDNDESAGVHADDDEKDPLSSSLSSPSTDVFISAETMMDAEETIDPREAQEDALIQIHPGWSVIAHDDDDDNDESAEEPLLSPTQEFAKNTPPDESAERLNC